MKKIGEGYYYDVFETDSNLVVKKVKNRLKIFSFIIFANRFNVLNAIKEYRNVLKALPRLNNEYSKILKLIFNRSLIGNPVFVNDTDYKQDWVSDLRNINTLSDQEFIKVIYDYITLLKNLWSFGTSDSVFNFSINCGYNSKNQLVLIDFNEMTCNKNEVVNQIKNKIWLKRSSYLSLTKEKQKIFKEIMDREIITELARTVLASSVKTPL